jgi:low temperature requirement protein LtrA
MTATSHPGSGSPDGPGNADGSGNADGPGIQRATTLELFLDLVFVFTITELTGLVAHPTGPADYARLAVVFLTLAWIYDGFIWLTSNLLVRTRGQRLVLLTAMAGFFVMALSIPTVFHDGGVPFGLGLLLVTVVHAVLFRTTSPTTARAISGIAPFNVASAVFVLAAGLTPLPWKWIWWAAAAMTLMAAAVPRRTFGFAISPAHFVDRHGLLMIVALGESVVSVGVGATGRPLTPALLGFAIAALALSAALWWSYFDVDDSRAEQSMVVADPSQRARMALLGFGAGHFVMILGVVLAAAGLKVGVVQPWGGADAVAAANLGVGLSVYLLGDALYRRILGIGRPWPRLAAAALCVATIPVGILVGPLAQVLAAVALLAVLLWRESSRPVVDQAPKAPVDDAT